jgi:ABC-type phosphate/phosphonate transport system substrate-binding protein
LPYGEAIRALVERGPDRGYLGRITPYAFVVAEMLGAKLDILATYKSVATRDTIYHSYFVVRKDRFRAVVKRRAEDGATFEDVTAYLKGFREVPARFVYHDRFSTSSYFIPSLYFKARDIFAVDQPTNPSFIPIQVERLPSTSSADLVARVVNGGADLAAVWDGTKHMFENDPARAAMNAQVLFIRIPTAIPNDFLVASGIDGERERLIIEAIKNEPGAGRPCTELTESTPAAIPRRPCSDPSIETPRDDFDGWYAWDSVPESAKEALASLRQSARPQITPVVVRIEGLAGRRVSMADVEAVREAVRLSGTELVPEDRNLHKRVDMTWTLDSTHDGALRLTSTLDSSFGQSAEEFIISFVDRRELPQRIADLIRSRMRRIRYVWPFEQKYPVVLRDLDFTPDNIVKVQRISWRDPDTNEYEEDTPFSAQIEDSTDFSKLRLSDEVKFARNPDGSFNFDPISNVAYRVIIEPEPRPGRIWIVVTYLALAALALACVGLIVDLNRHAAAAR